MSIRKLKLTKDLLNTLKSTKAEFDFNVEDFASDNSGLYKTNEEVIFEIGDKSYLIDIDITHTWDNETDGDGYNNPYINESVNEETDVEINGLYLDGEEMNLNELKKELTSLIYEKCI